ncbi:hypothetical protein HKD37_01G000370 [Glycine soja]
MFATTKSSTLSPLFSFSRTTTSVPSKPKFWNLVPMNQSSSPGHLALGLDNPRRTLHVFCGSTSQHASQRSSIQVNGYGIDSMASFFLDYGYTQREELRFPAKKLRALWFSPPADSLSSSGSGINGPLPRILFISELLVDQMSSQTQYSALASSLGRLTWEKPLYCEFQQLASESEYAAWTLVKVSPDDLLQQRSTVADSISFQFSE